MKVIACSEGLTKGDIWRMTKDPKVKKIKDVGGEVLTLRGFVKYTDLDSKENEVTLLAISTEEGNFCTNSDTFIRQFMEMYEHFEGDINRIEVVEDKSKNNRTFYQCSYVD